MGHFQHEDVTRMSTAIPSLLTVLATAIFAVQGAGLYQEGFRGDPKHYEVSGHNSKVVCYWGTWSNYRPGNGKFTPESIDPKLCTHLIYSFAGLDSNTWEIKPLDPWMDLSENYGLAGYEKTTALKYANPKLKVTIAIGGWNQGSLPYSDMAKDPEKRKLFVKSVLAFIKKYNFDGLDLDWEYPGEFRIIKSTFSFQQINTIAANLIEQPRQFLIVFQCLNYEICYIKQQSEAGFLRTRKTSSC